MLQDDDPDPQPRDAVWDSVDVHEHDDPDSVDLVVETATMMSVFAAQQLVRIDELCRDARARGVGSRDIIDRGLRLELAAALRVTEYVAGDLMARADALVHRYPQMLDLLSTARTTEHHAKIFVDAMAGVEPEFHDRIVPLALALAEAEPSGAFRRALRTLIETVRSTTIEQRHELALAGRRVIVEHADDAMAWLSLFAPAVELQAIQGRLTAMAKVIAADEGETRTLDQIRADVASDLLIQGDTAAVAPAARGVRATVAVTVPVLALLDDAVAVHSEPARVEGVGPVPLSKARELCAGADGWMRVLTHSETGAVLSVGRDTYRPPPELRKIVRWRADRCMAPGCGMPAARCQIDHTIAWECGGTTTLINLAPLCQGHHTVKHHGGWRVRQIPDSGGALEWTSPSGRRYRVDPERRVPVFAPSGPDRAPF